MDDLNEQVLKRVCAILDKPCYEGRKDLLVLKLCEDIAAGCCVVIDYANKSIYSLHPTKQDV
jgi:hypothetical protein